MTCCRTANTKGLHEDGASAHTEPSRDLEDERFQAALADAIAHLPERERLVLALYYDEELNLKEIGEVLGVSESRISQLYKEVRGPLAGTFGAVARALGSLIPVGAGLARDGVDAVNQ